MTPPDRAATIAKVEAAADRLYSIAITERNATDCAVSAVYVPVKVLAEIETALREVLTLLDAAPAQGFRRAIDDMNDAMKLTDETRDKLDALSASHEALTAMQLYTLQQLEAAEAQVAALTARVAQLEGALTAVNALATEWAAQHGQRFGGPYRECASKLRAILAALTEPEPEK
jgi:chromosome segregation ATPase